MKPRRHLWHAVVILVGMLLLASYGSSGQPGTSWASPSATADTCDQSGPAPGITATTITVGVTLPLTGSAATSGQGALAGEKAYFDYVNARGGVQGRKINLIVLDDQYQPAYAQQQMRLLVQQYNIFAVIGGYGTPTFLAQEPFLKDQDVPVIAFSAQSSQLGTMATPNAYMTFVNYITQYQIETKYIIDTYRPRSMALVGVAGNVGDDAFKGMQLAVGSSGIPIKYIPETPGNPNLTPIATTLKDTNADWVFIILTAADSGQLLRAMQRIGYSPRLAGNHINADSSFIEPFKDVAEGMVVSVITADLSSSEPKVKEFAREFQRLTGSAPTTNNVLGWAQAMVGAEALRTAPALTRSCFYYALNRMTNYRTRLIAPVTFGPTTRQGVDAIGLAQIRNGKLVYLVPGFVSLQGLK